MNVLSGAKRAVTGKVFSDGYDVTSCRKRLKVSDLVSKISSSSEEMLALLEVDDSLPDTADRRSASGDNGANVFYTPRRSRDLEVSDSRPTFPPDETWLAPCFVCGVFGVTDWHDGLRWNPRIVRRSEERRTTRKARHPIYWTNTRPDRGIVIHCRYQYSRARLFIRLGPRVA
jgi:hypothetical protein